MAFAVDFPNQYAYLTVIFNFCQETIMAQVITQTLHIRCNKMLDENILVDTSMEIITETQFRAIRSAVESMLEGTGVFIEVEKRPISKAQINY